MGLLKGEREYRDGKENTARRKGAQQISGKKQGKKIEK
jgi:hypothetical protein